MKIKRHDLSGFSDLGTVVFYPTRTFHLEVQGVGVSNPDKIIEKASTKTFLYSVELNSEYLDFAKYNFRFDLPETKYWSSLLLNQYDYQNTVSKFGEEFDSVSENLFPQVISSKDTEEKHFFGRLANSENTIFLINIPPEIETISGSLIDPKTVWKVEFYNSRLTSNNTLNPEVFIDYDVLSVLHPDLIKEEPILSVYFGPSWNTQIQDYTLDDLPDEYMSRYTYGLFDNNLPCLTKDIYNSFPEYLSKSEYIKMVKEEINSEKILYIINTTDGDLKTIDMFSAAYSESNLKYRNQSKNILRNDETKGYQLLEKKGDLVFDSRSSTLLGIGGDINDCPLLRGKIEGRDIYSTSSDSGAVSVNGKTYIHPKNQEVLGENPVISPYWISKGDLKESMFDHFYITKTGHGEITPGGLVYLRSGRTLEVKVTPDKGHRFKEIQGLKEGEGYDKTGDKVTPVVKKSGDKFRFIFEEIVYTLRLNLSCDSDYPNFGESHVYQLSDLEDKNIKLWYYDYTQEKDVQYTGGNINITYTKPFKFWVDTEDSLYYTPNRGQYFYLEDSNTTLETTPKYTVLSIKETPQKLLDSSNIISIIGALKSKQYTVNIETTKEIQVSTKKKLIFEYGEPVEIMFAYEGDTQKEIDIKIINTDTKEESTEGWIKTVDSDGIVTLQIPERTRKNPDLGIKSNYKIIASI